VRDSWRALWVSRLVVLFAGVGAAVAFGVGRARSAFDPAGVTSGFGWLGDLLAAPVARWDAVWYLVIAHYGYRPELAAFGTAPRTAFFPLYPLGVRAISELGAPPILAGVAISLAALAAALYGIHRLCTLELDRLTGLRNARSRPTGGLDAEGHPAGQSAHRADVARLAVLATALAPMAFFLSAVYSEALYLALSVGVFWCARNGRWAWTGVLGALASTTRSAGLVLVVPILVLYLYGPREDRAPGFQEVAWWRPRYRPRRDVLWVAALPAAVGAYMAYLALKGGSALMPFHAQAAWNRHFAGPYVAVWDGARAAFDGVRQLLSFQRAHVYFKVAGGSPFVDAGHNLMLFAFLLAAVPMVVGVLHRLPFAYGAYVLAALALPLSYPVAPQPLMSLPRFEVVLFPLAMWLGAWLAERPRARLPTLVGMALLMALFVGEFATWHWVA
ncbi:MAG TPA: mannosyltransferase family protein, partial [Solirubrobacteraceae bacterium]|nr:mannosyltransferase family protein [Solirubrobacteraceae bacterium]